MTDYIEEMMETAGCEEKRCPNNVYDELCKKYEFCNNAPHCKIYPAFTAEKQLELIKLISTNRIGKDYKILEIGRDEIDNLYYFSLTNKEDKCQSTYVSNKDFTQALAQLIIELMKAGELDKEKINEVLKCN